MHDMFTVYTTGYRLLILPAILYLSALFLCPYTSHRNVLPAMVLQSVTR